MDGKTIVEFNEITTVESGDKLLGVDISDTSASAGGTNKHFTKGNLLKEYVTLVGEETLTNKTLTSPVVTDVDITGGSVTDVDITGGSVTDVDITGGSATDIDITGGSISESTNVVEVLKKVYPVGCIYTSTVSTNPNTLFGFGTWSAFGAGRTLVGIDSGDTDFDTVEETGGAKTHTLTVAEMPAHRHPMARADGGTTYQYSYKNNIGHPTSGVAYTESAGSGSAHNNLQPYIVVYFWQRTA